MSIGGRRVAGFQIKAGIRQGCPLSPLLFAIVADILLRRLQRTFPHATRKAYADDLAMVVDELLDEGKPIMDMFDEYQMVSGLRLNMKKVVVVPLWFPDALRQFQQKIVGPQLNREEQIRRALVQRDGRWAEAAFSDKAEYLGFCIGPGAGQTSWERLFCKAMKTVMLWREVGCSLFYTTLLYNVYILPTLTFIAQLLEVPESWGNMEETLCRKLIRSPAKMGGPYGFPTTQKILSSPGII